MTLVGAPVLNAATFSVALCVIATRSARRDGRIAVGRIDAVQRVVQRRAGFRRGHRDRGLIGDVHARRRRQSSACAPSSSCRGRRSARAGDGVTVKCRRRAGRELLSPAPHRSIRGDRRRSATTRPSMRMIDERPGDCVGTRSVGRRSSPGRAPRRWSIPHAQTVAGAGQRERMTAAGRHGDDVRRCR